MIENRENAIEKIQEFQRFGSVLGLERMTSLLNLLGNPQDDIKVIHVAGTNGKGSVCRYIYCVLQAAGYKTGLYTSPFLERFNERIEFDGKYISDEDISIYTERVLEAANNMISNGEQSPTEFEVVTAIGLLYFKEKNADYVILEVGLGGSGDSTNVCNFPLVSVITSVSMDHMDRLGDTIEQIASEKAGIIKDGCPVVTSVSNLDALEVIRNVAKEHNCKLLETKDLSINIHEQGLNGSCFDITLEGMEFSDVKISMVGKHQVENAVAAICAIKTVEKAGKISVDKKALYGGLENAHQPGRLEIFDKLWQDKIVIIDGAHNTDGAKALSNTLKSLYAGKRILMVIGMLADKDISGIISEFTNISKDFIVTEPDNPRKLKADTLANKLQEQDCCCIVAPIVEDAYAKAYEIRESYDIIVCAGSLYMIGQMRTLIDGEAKK